MTSSWSKGYGASDYYEAEACDPYQSTEQDAFVAQDVPDKKQSRAWVVASASCVLLALSGVFATVGMKQRGRGNTKVVDIVPVSESALTLDGCSFSTPSLRASNEYGVFAGEYPWLEDGYTHLVEPYKESTLTLSGVTCDGYTYMWEGVDEDGEPAFAIEGDKLSQTLTLEQSGIYTLTVTAKDPSSGQTGVVYTGTVVSK
jgi:hypothetical protein